MHTHPVRKAHMLLIGSRVWLGRVCAPNPHYCVTGMTHRTTPFHSQHTCSTSHIPVCTPSYHQHAHMVSTTHSQHAHMVITAHPQHVRMVNTPHHKWLAPHIPSMHMVNTSMHTWATPHTPACTPTTIHQYYQCLINIG